MCIWSNRPILLFLYKMTPLSTQRPFQMTTQVNNVNYIQSALKTAAPLQLRGLTRGYENMHQRAVRIPERGSLGLTFASALMMTNPLKVIIQ